jgi:hypothetical protein
MGHVTMENRHGLAAVGTVTLASGTAVRRASERTQKTKARELAIASPSSWCQARSCCTRCRSANCTGATGPTRRR